MAPRASENPPLGRALRYGTICPPSFRAFVLNITAGRATILFSWIKSATPGSEKSCLTKLAPTKYGVASSCPATASV